LSPSYGTKGGLFPVKPGQVWTLGGHLVACGDLEKGDGARFLKWARDTTGREPSMFYCDPPWSPAFITRFRKGAEVDLSQAYTVETVCQCLMRLAGSTPFLMEMGVTYDVDTIDAWAREVGLPQPPGFNYGALPITYAGGKPAQLFGFNLTRQQGEAFRCLVGMDDERIPATACELFTSQGDVVVDLCLGLGATARGAEKVARSCWGMELHPRRCSASLSDLRKLCGGEPCMIGEF
jgi:hypothetical protein